LDAATLSPFASVTTIADQLTALVAGLDKFSDRISVAPHGAYVPAMTWPATGTSADLRGGISDLNGIWWDAEWPDHDYYHDHAKSFLWLAPPGGVTAIHR